MSWKYDNLLLINFVRIAISFQNIYELTLNMQFFKVLCCILISEFCHLQYKLINSNLMITEILTHLCQSEISECFFSPLHKIKLLYRVCKTHFSISSPPT